MKGERYLGFYATGGSRNSIDYFRAMKELGIYVP